MKKIFIATLAVLAFAGCNNEKKAENAEANATETVASVSSSDIAVVDVIFVVNESEIAKTEGVVKTESGLCYKVISLGASLLQALLKELVGQLLKFITHILYSLII